MLNKMNADLEIIYNEIQTKLIPRNIKKDVTILGVVGTLEKNENADATSDGNLDPQYLLTGYAAVVDSELINGTMPTYGSRTIVPTSDDITIPTGHYTRLTISQVNAANCTDYYNCRNAIRSI